MTPDYTKLAPSGDYEFDCAEGRRFASLLIDHMANTGETFLLGYTVAHMMRRGDGLNGVDVGILAEFSERACGRATSPAPRV